MYWECVQNEGRREGGREVGKYGGSEGVRIFKRVKNKKITYSYIFPNSFIIK